MASDIKERIDKIDKAIKKHKALAAWGNVESKQRLRELRQSKKDILAGRL
jgi:hypothetical protein